MKANIKIEGINYTVDFSNGESIAITLVPNGNQPNHFAAQKATSKALETENFIGDTKRGGSCNVNLLTLTPHCNGTHTESISHIIDELIPVHEAIDSTVFPCVMITVSPTIASTTSDCYFPSMDEDNLVITRQSLKDKLSRYSDWQLHGLVVRTSPNHSSKQTMEYDASHYPPYFTNDAVNYLVERKISHLLVDFPSVDKMYDEGALSNHRLFWCISAGQTKRNAKSMSHKTITEMIYAKDEIGDGVYLCNLQFPEIEIDAVPSRPILYKLERS